MKQQRWFYRCFLGLWSGNGFSVFYIAPFSVAMTGLVLLGLVIREQYGANRELNAQISEATQLAGFATQADYSQALANRSPTAETLRWTSIIDVVRTTYILDVLNGMFFEPRIRQNGKDTFHIPVDERQLKLEWNDSQSQFYCKVKPLVDRIHELVRSNVKMDPIDRANHGGMLSLLLRLDCDHALAGRDLKRAVEDLDGLYWLSDTAGLEGPQVGFERSHEVQLQRAWVFSASCVVESGLVDRDALERLEVQRRLLVAKMERSSSEKAPHDVLGLDFQREAQFELYATRHLGMHGRDSVLPYLIQLPSRNLARLNTRVERATSSRSMFQLLDSRRPYWMVCLELAVDIRRFELTNGRWPKDDELSDRAKLLLRENRIELERKQSTASPAKGPVSPDSDQEWKLFGYPRFVDFRGVFLEMLPTIKVQ